MANKVAIPRIDPEFEKLIPPLSAAELAGLENSLLAHGCRDALITWREILLDGHNRLRLCTKHGLRYHVQAINLPSREAAKAWIIQNQFARRNLTPFQRVELALRLEPLLAGQAKRRMLRGKADPAQNSAEGETRDQLAAIASVSHDTVDKVRLIIERAPEADKEKLRRGETTINHEYWVVAGRKKLGEVSQDAIPEPPGKPVTKLGDLWLLGKHRLLCGDSTRPESVQRLMGDERAVLFATDPPYAVNYSGGSHPATRANRGKANKDKDWSKVYREAGSTTFENESGGADEGRSFYLSFCRVAVSHAIAPNAAWYCWHASKRQAMLEAVWNEVGAFVHQQIIWFKSRPVLTYSVYMWAHEPCMFGWIKGQKPEVGRKEEGGYPSTVWQVPNAEIETSEHPTSKPNRLFAIPMELHTSPNDLCYEPFSGSGSQLIAAEQLGRRCYAIELEPRFVDVAVARWEKLTGKKAELESRGRVTARRAKEES
ncbi:MAG TPA: DNA methyltransferase [Candidatus Binatus sp.]|uniref:DNA methyltransferase n=1 Tax=Candidatus Binatus sp. TaxID=2811406 RepID=UPI002B48CD9E|nr:DNA methyltransferase [Candidatus Binatus sp.]HKN13982.1 DNA methyltransferase [Candidatus Binatus sp.]